MVRCRLLTAGADTNKRYSRGHCGATALHAVVAATPQFRADNTSSPYPALPSSLCDFSSMSSASSASSHSLSLDSKCVMAEALLEAGCEVDARMDDSCTPALHLAVRQGDLAMTRVLLKHGADVNLKERHSGISPLREAASTVMSAR
ncbi:hypothetical protein CEUSTIGMA_g1928.t1 [Chlamydomonas eustigma]|uniref:Uncharacterized protein n=1 Tax=Chlamydomonas eustigma TaxID=1157962 RepID=A0A250WUU0_9CHLO|nr:hypothetical protein CEUSTIGMA_g1928.t1 [Chlamydomonas eustigma]|eukprot:GAX74479.1 hypothetical protein CEUSTIGMA_g1928.t1 [Chlamydomonas eustigma]